MGFREVARQRQVPPGEAGQPTAVIGTHISLDDFRVIRDNLAGGHLRTRTTSNDGGFMKALVGADVQPNVWERTSPSVVERLSANR